MIKSSWLVYLSRTESERDVDCLINTKINFRRGRQQQKCKFWHKIKFKTFLLLLSKGLCSKIIFQNSIIRTNNLNCFKIEDDKFMEKMAEHENFWSLKWNLAIWCMDIFKEISKETDCSVYLLYVDCCINMLQEFCLLPNEARFFFPFHA